MSENIKETIKKRYADVVSDNCGCGPSCCSNASDVTFSENYTEVEGYIEEADYGLGCGIPTAFAQIKEGDTVLDLGSGAGNDVFVARRLVGENGHVIGVDMTEPMIEKANQNKEKLGYQNVDFVLGDIEKLPIEGKSIDVALSNCVLNLVSNKYQTYKEVYRVLKPKGHFSISDIVLNGVLPRKLKNAAEMYVGCVSGALEKDDYIQAIKEAGFKNIQIVKERKIKLPDNLLMEYMSADEIAAFKNSKNAILSITVYAEK